jgi:hypothetical protein
LLLASRLLVRKVLARERETLASEILAGEELGLEALLGFGNAGWA